MRYACPQHPDVVLFEELVEKRMLPKLPEPPRKCPKCDRYYFKAECKRQP